jgi:hypothetical protein
MALMGNFEYVFRRKSQIALSTTHSHAGRQFRNHGPFPPSAAEVVQERTSRFEKWTAAAFQGAPKTRPWLIDGVLPLGIPGMFAARGGVGKSYLLGDLALRIATGTKVEGLDFNTRLIFGGNVVAHGTAVVFYAEDDSTTVRERLDALDPEGQRFASPGRLRLTPLPDDGGVRPLFQSTPGGGFQTTAEYDAVRAFLLSLPDLRLVAFDPLQAFVAVDITAKPEAGQFVWSAFSALAAETGATVLAAHHVGKSKTNKRVDDGEDLRDAIRGTTALVDGARWVYGLWELPEGGRDDAACVAGTVVKANLKASRREHYYRRTETGVLRQVPPTIVPNEYSQQLDALEKAIVAAAAAGYPFMHTGKNGLDANRQRLPAPLNSLAKAPLEKLGRVLLDENRIAKGTAKGSRTREWLDGPDGSFAAGHGELRSGAEPMCS